MNPEELAVLLRELDTSLRARSRAELARDLPLDELVFDRWQRARDLGFGADASIYRTSYVYGDVHVGEGTWVGPFTVLDGTGGLTIGCFCSISSGVHVYTHETVRWALSGGRARYGYKPVAIGDCCFVGPHTVIAPGVTVGDRSLIGAGSFVNRDVASETIAFGSPARPRGRVEVDDAGDVRLVFS